MADTNSHKFWGKIKHNWDLVSKYWNSVPWIGNRPGGAGAGKWSKRNYWGKERSRVKNEIRNGEEPETKHRHRLKWDRH